MTHWCPEPVAVSGSGVLGEARGGQLVPDARREHEEHKARVLADLRENRDGCADDVLRAMSHRQHHSEATDALVVEALQAAAAINGACGDCATCDDALDQIKAALKALGK